MSSIKLSPNASGTGIFTIAAPNSNTDRTLTLPDQTGTVLTNAGPYTANASASAGAVTIDASNNVGIGTSSPNKRLHIQNGVSGASNYGVPGLAIESSSNVDLQMMGSTTGQLGITFSDSANNQAGFLYYQNNGDYMQFATNGSERARIGSSGQTDFYITNADGIQARSSAAAGTAYANFVGKYSATGTGNGTISFIVWNNGNVVNNNNSYGSTSDIKLKENIVDTTPKLEKLNQVRVVNYNLKDQPGQKLLGVIAQELEQIFPGMVEETADRDEEGNDLGTTTKSVKYSVFVPMLIKAIQEQQALIESLTARIAALEAQP